MTTFLLKVSPIVAFYERINLVLVPGFGLRNFGPIIFGYLRGLECSKCKNKVTFDSEPPKVLFSENDLIFASLAL